MKDTKLYKKKKQKTTNTNNTGKQLKGKKMEQKDTKKFDMNVKYYSCWDKAGECYLPMFEANTDLRAIRLLEDTVADKSTGIGKHPEDFRLDCILEINRRNGEVVTNKIRKIMEASEYGKQN